MLGEPNWTCCIHQLHIRKPINCFLGLSWTKSVWSDHSPHSPSPCATGDKEVGNLVVNWSLWRRGGWEGGVFKIWFYFSSPYSDGNKYISCSSVCFSHDRTWWVISSCLYLTQEPFLFPLTPVQLGREVMEKLWWAPGVHPGQPTGTQSSQELLYLMPTQVLEDKLQ